MQCTLKRETPDLVALTAEGQRVADPALADQEPFQPQDIAKMYDLARHGKMAVVQVDVDRPDEMRLSCTLPLLAFVRMNNPAVVLPKIAREMDDQTRRIGSQVRNMLFLQLACSPRSEILTCVRVCAAVCVC